MGTALWDLRRQMNGICGDSWMGFVGLVGSDL